MTTIATSKPKPTRRARSPGASKAPAIGPARASAGRSGGRALDTLLEEARRNRLLAGEKSEHVSFRAAPALVAAAKRETGIASTSELGTLALALLAQPDPVAAILRRTRGRLGKDHTLDC